MNLMSRFSSSPSRRALRSSFAATPVLLGLLLGSLQGKAQSTPLPATAKSDPQAVAIIEAAIASMGGVTAWRQVGAATAQVTLSSPARPEQKIQWADDWSKGYLRSRRDSVNNGQSVTMLSSRTSRLHRLADGKVDRVPHENDIATLAIGYPAAALNFSLQLPSCSFYSGTVPAFMRFGGALPSDAQLVREDCIDLLMPTGSARLTWIFSKATSLPLQVQGPVRDMLHNRILYETVRYMQFQKYQSVIAPSRLSITRPSGTVDTLQIANTALLPSAPDSTFHLER